MFELGKKEGSENNHENSAQNEQQSRRNAARKEGASAASATTSRNVAVIGRSIRIDGDLQGEEDLCIEGDVNGTIRLQNNTLTIGSEGKIQADVYAKSVIVDGMMEGDLYSSERVEIRKNATVHGNITAPRVSLEDGARFKGSMEMDPQAVEAAIGVVANAATTNADSEADSRARAKDQSKASSGLNGDKHAAKPKAASRDNAAAREPVG